jgi:hypothetical protein
VLNEDKSFLHKLNFPIEGKVNIYSLTYKPFVNIDTVRGHLKGIKARDSNGMICGYIAALTSKRKDVIENLDTSDYSIAQSIVVFFL